MKYFFILFLLVLSCRSVPKNKLSQFTQKISYEVKNDSLIISINNPLRCPLRTNATSKNDQIQNLISKDFPIILAQQTDTLLTYPTTLQKEAFKIRFTSTFGNPTDSIRSVKINLPFPNGKQYKIIQGYNGSYSHTSNYSRYALDFNLQIGDTICSVADGYVVGVIKGYKYGGSSSKWRNYANFITLFHPESNLFTQYVHLQYQGSFVEVGDEVKAGQVIGLSGMTGYTDVAHLHFNVLRPLEKEMISTKVNFLEGYQGSALKRGSKVRR